MHEYQAVVHRFANRTRDDEEALTDLLNARSRAGWEPILVAQDQERVTIIFRRPVRQDG